MPVRTGVAVARSFSPHYSNPAPGVARPAPVSQDAWKPWGNHASGTARDTATTATGAMSGARSTATMSNLFDLAGRVRRDHEDHHQSTDAWRWREATRVTQQPDYPAADTDRLPSLSPSPSPLRAFGPPSSMRPPPPPPLSAASLRASLRRPEGERLRSPSPTGKNIPTSVGVATLTRAAPDPSLRPRPHACTPVGQRLGNDKDEDGDRDRLREGMSMSVVSARTRTRTRPQPRRAPSEDQDDERVRRASERRADSEREREGGSGSDGHGSDCGSEWWAGGGSGREEGGGGSEGEPGSGGGPSRGLGAHAQQQDRHQQDKPLYVVCL